MKQETFYPLTVTEMPDSPQTAVVIAASPVVTIPANGTGPIIISLPLETATEDRLSNLLRLGRLYHPLCRNAFVERVQIGYYSYERREEWRTCALAAAYAGAFDPQSIERPDFSYSQAIWRLSQRVGFAIDRFRVIGPTGRRNTLDREMIQLVDANLWTRDGVADWLASLGL